MTYCAKKNGGEGYLDAMHEIRRRGLLAGKFAPYNDEERDWLRLHQRRETHFDVLEAAMLKTTRALGLDLGVPIAALIDAMKECNWRLALVCLRPVFEPWREARERACRT